MPEQDDLMDFSDFEEGSTTTSDEDLLDFSEVENELEQNEETNNATEDIQEVADIDNEQTSETEISSTDTTLEVEEEWEDIDLNALFDSLTENVEESKDALDKIEEETENTEDVSALRDSLKKMEDQLKKLNNTNADLKFRNAELEAFSVEDADPKVMIVVKNFPKAKDWDDKSKSRTIDALKDLIYDLSWEDFDATNIDRNIDMLTASEMYNNEINPNLKEAKQDPFASAVIDV